MSKNRPYFLWDYELSDADVRRILKGKNETEKIWMMSRILTSARFEDVWNYLRPRDIVEMFPKLRLRPQKKLVWEKALNVWGYHV